MFFFSKIKIFVLNLCLVFSSSLILLIIFEFYLIWDDYYKPYQNPYKMNINNIPYSFYLNPEELEFNYKSKVFILGDSMVAGSACATKNKNLSANLNKIAQINNEKIKFFNFGMEAKSVSHYIDIVKNLNIHKNDMVIIFLCENDIQINKEICTLGKRQKLNLNLFYPPSCELILKGSSKAKNENTFLKRINNRLKKYKTYKLIKEAVANTPYINSLLYRYEFRTLWLNTESEERKFLISSILSLKKIVDNIGAQFVLSYYPLTNSIEIKNSQHKMWLSFIEYMKLNYSIKIFDPLPFLKKNSKDNQMTWSLTDKHPSCLAHNIMAKYIYKEVLFSNVN